MAVDPQEDLRITLQFEEIEVAEPASVPAELLAAVDDVMDVATYGRPRPFARDPRDDTSPLGGMMPAEKRVGRVYEEVTAVRQRPNNPDQVWVDCHAVVRDGKLALPAGVSKRLAEGAIVEIRIAAWAVDK